MKKILSSDKLAEAGIYYLNEQPGIQIHIETGLNEDRLCKIIGGYDALLLQLLPYIRRPGLTYEF